MIFDKPFDAVAGRYVLQFMKDPAAAVARLARHAPELGAPLRCRMLVQSSVAETLGGSRADGIELVHGRA